ncbi:MAG: IS110 family transposase [Crocinitomicaceae bacterium]
MQTFIGIDWASDKHDICALAPDGRLLGQFIISHDIAGFQQLQSYLLTCDEIVIAIERPNGLLVEFLLEHSWDLRCVTPNVTAARRPRRHKSDLSDAYLLANMLRMNDIECRPIIRDSQLVMNLKQMTQAHLQLLAERTRLSNQLHYALKQYYPALLKVFCKLAQPLTLTFLQHYPSPDDAQALSLEDLRLFLKSQNYSHMRRLQSIYEMLQEPTQRSEAQAGYIQHMLSLTVILRAIVDEVVRLERELVTLFKQHPEADWWLQFPGLGAVNAARLLARIGDNRQNFKSANELRAVAGTVPITQHSGQRKRVLFRRSCSHVLRKAFYDLAMKSKPKCDWAKTYYKEQIKRGHNKPRANRALSNRWAGIIWKLWKTRENYDEKIHVANQQRHKQALVA